MKRRFPKTGYLILAVSILGTAQILLAETSLFYTQNIRGSPNIDRLNTLVRLSEILMATGGATLLLAVAIMAYSYVATLKRLLRFQKASRLQARAIRDAESALQQSEEKYRLLFEHAQDGIALFGNDLQVLIANPRITEITGYAPGELFFNAPIDIVHPEDRPVVLENYRRRWAGLPAERTYTFRIRRKDGALVHLEGSFDLITQNNKPVGVLAVIRDISERARTLNALRAIAQGVPSEKGTEFFSHILSQLTLSLEIDHAILALTSTDRNTLTVTAACLSGRTSQSSFAIPRNIQPLANVLRTGEVGSTESPPAADLLQDTPLGDLNIRWSFAAPLLRPDGEVIGALAVMHHQTPRVTEQLESLIRIAAARISAELERKRIEQELRHSESRLRTLFEGIDDALLVYDKYGNILDANASACQQIGVSRGQLLNMTIQDVLAGWDEIANKPVARQKEWSEIFLKCVDDRKIPVMISRRQIHYQGWHATLLLAHDISQQIKQQEERHRIEVKLQQMQHMESLGILAGGIAHEFNNILMGIMSNATIVQSRLGPDSPLTPFLERVIAATERAARLSKEMLTYTGKSAGKPVTLDLSKVINEIADLLTASISKKASISFLFPPTPVLVCADRSQFQQIVINLIANASEALEDQPGEITVSTGLKPLSEEDINNAFFGDRPQPGVYAFVQVTDSGKGIPPENIPKLFDPFFTTKFSGRGIGLSAVMGIVRSHKGLITVETAAGKGSSFTVYLPPAEEARPLSPSSTPPAHHAGDTILVVDDEALVADAVQSVLEEKGYKVIVARDGQEALDYLEQQAHRIALVLLDATMPRLTGEEVFRRFHNAHPEIPVILSSGYTQEQTASSMQGLAGFLQKPYKLDELLATVARFIASPSNTAD